MEDLPVEQLVPELLTSLTPSALTTSATFLPWPSRTSASRSSAMISSARKPLRGIDLPPNALQALTSAWTDSRGEGHPSGLGRGRDVLRQQHRHEPRRP